MYLTHLFGAYSLIRLFNDFICKPERLKFGISKFKFIGPVSFIAWTEVAWGRVIFVISVYSVSPGILRMPHSTELLDSL